MDRQKCLEQWVVSSLAREKEQLRRAQESLPEWLLESIEREQRALGKESAPAAAKKAGATN